MIEVDICSILELLQPVGTVAQRPLGFGKANMKYPHVELSKFEHMDARQHCLVSLPSCIHHHMLGKGTCNR